MLNFLTSYNSNSQSVEWVIPLEDKIRKITYVDGFYLLKKDGRTYVQDSLGNRHHIEIEYNKIKEIIGEKTHYIVYQEGDKKGLIDFDNKKIIPPDYFEIRALNDQCFQVRKGSRGVLNTDNKFLINLKWNIDIYSVDESSFAVKKRGRSHFVVYSNSGDSLGTKGYAFFADLQKYENQFIDIDLKGKRGLIHNNGDTLIPHDFVSFRPFGDSLIIAEQLIKKPYKKRRIRKYGLYNIEGREILAPIYDGITQRSGTPDDIAFIRTNGVENIINTSGQILLDKFYKSIFIINDSRLLTQGLSEDGRYLYYVRDASGKQLSSKGYENAHSIASNNFILASNNENYSVLNNDGKIIREMNGVPSLRSTSSDGIFIMHVKGNEGEDYIMVDNNLKKTHKDTFCSVGVFRTLDAFQTTVRGTKERELRNMNGEIITTYYGISRVLYPAKLLTIERNFFYGVIDKNGNIILDCKYDNFKKMDNGIYRVRQSDFYGIIKVE